MEHLSRTAIERSIARNHSLFDADPEAEHLRSCPECLDRKLTILADRAEYLQRFPAAEFARGVLAKAKAPSTEPARRHAWWTSVPAWAAAAAVAAGFVVLWQGQRRLPEPRSLDPRPGEPSRTSEPDGPGEIRIKGPASRLDVYVKREGQAASLLGNGETLAKGDRLAFSVALTEPLYLMLLGVDAAGSVTRYYPAPGATRAGPLPTGTAQLEVGVELDDSRGEERMIALFSRAPLEEQAVLSRLASALAVQRRTPGGAPEPLSLELGVEQAQIWFRK